MQILIALTFFFLASAFTLTDYQKSPRNLSHLRTVVSKTTDGHLLSHLREFVSCCRPSRLIGTEGNTQAFVYLETLLKKKSSGKLSIHTYELAALEKNDLRLTPVQFDYFQALESRQGKTLIWEKKGSEKPEEVLMVAAHADNLTLDSEKKIQTTSISLGADNNGTGVAALLQLIEYLDLMPVKKTVRVIFFNYGEWDAMGLQRYFADSAKSFEKEKIAAILQVKMLGHSSARTHLHQKENQLRLYATRSEDTAQAESFKSVGSEMSRSMDFMVAKGRSIKGNLGQGANLLLSQDLDFDINPRQHSTDDFVETLNASYFREATRVLIGMVLGWAFELEK